MWFVCTNNYSSPMTADRTTTCPLAAMVWRIMFTALVELAAQEPRAKPIPFSLVEIKSVQLNLLKCYKKQNRQISHPNSWQWLDLDMEGVEVEEEAEDVVTCPAGEVAAGAT
jgi:hypothetical protein